MFFNRCFKCNKFIFPFGGILYDWSWWHIKCVKRFVLEELEKDHIQWRKPTQEEEKQLQDRNIELFNVCLTYAKGDAIIYNFELWISKYDNNVLNVPY